MCSVFALTPPPGEVRSGYSPHIPTRHSDTWQLAESAEVGGKNVLRRSSLCCFTILIDLFFSRQGDVEVVEITLCHFSFPWQFFLRYCKILTKYNFELLIFPIEWGGIFTWTELVTWPHTSHQPNIKVKKVLTSIATVIYVNMDASKKTTSWQRPNLAAICLKFFPSLAFLY